MAGLLNTYSNISPYHPGVEYPRFVRKLVPYSNERKMKKKAQKERMKITKTKGQFPGRKNRETLVRISTVMSLFLFFIEKNESEL